MRKTKPPTQAASVQHLFFSETLQLQNGPASPGLHYCVGYGIVRYMKAAFFNRSFFPWLLTVALGWFVTGCSSHQPDTGQSVGAQSGSTDLTGSYLNQDITRNGEITNGKDNVQVLDRNKIDRSGATDVNQFLKTQGVR
jgi:hypothetical protein